VFNKYKSVKERDYCKTLTKEDYKYIALSNGDYYTYEDYLRMAGKLGYPLNEKRYKYPEDLRAAHDEADRKLDIENVRKQDKGIKSLVNKMQGLCYEKDGYTIFPLSCAEDLINESKALDHCVRQYVDRVARHESLIMFVRKVDERDKPFVTLELVKDKNTKAKSFMKQFKRITQVYGAEDSEVDNDTARFVMDWKQHFNLTGWSRDIAQAQ